MNLATAICVNNNCLIKLDSLFNDSFTFSTGDKITLCTNIDIDNEGTSRKVDIGNPRYMNVRGIVEKLPAKLKMIEQGQHSVSPMDWDTEIELNIGDDCIFDWDSLMRAIDQNLVFFENGFYYAIINYGHIYLSIVGDRITMLNGYVLLEPITEVKTGRGVIIPETIRKTISPKMGLVYRIGTPNKRYNDINWEDSSEIKEGYTVLFQSFATLKLEYRICKTLDKDYTIIQNRFIIAILPE